MRRRQAYALEREKESKMAINVPNSNIISDTAQPALKKKADIFLPHTADIKLPNGTPYRKSGSKPGKGVKNRSAGKGYR